LHSPADRPAAARIATEQSNALCTMCEMQENRY
jgi:hypothetical protein